MTGLPVSQADDGVHPPADAPNLRSSDGSTAQDTSTRIKEVTAELAFEAYASLRRAQAAAPGLLANERMAGLCEVAFLRFLDAFERP